MPFLISSEKYNNKFEIITYNDTNIINSAIIIIDDGYYNNITKFSNYLNSKLNELQLDICFNILDNSNYSQFKISDSGIQNNITRFTINFKKFYVDFYSLAFILGFDDKKSAPLILDSSNNIIQSNYPVNFNNNNVLYFCFDEFQSNIIETHKLFYKNNMSTNKILAKIDTASANKNNNFYITDLLEEENTDNVRKYTGNINLNSFNIKIIDYFGNIVNRNINDNIIFTLEIQINRNKLISIN
jgi:hypothetical protein